MYSLFLRVIYSLTYFIHIGIIGEIYQINKCGFSPSFNGDESFVQGAIMLLSIHYPLIFVIMCLVVSKWIVTHTSKLAVSSIQMTRSEPFGFEVFNTGIQLLPYMGFFFKEQFLGTWGVFILWIISIVFLASYGTFNLSLFFLGYKQYNVRAESKTIWLISKRRISNFSKSVQFYPIQENVYVRYE